ncbi:MAG: DUF4314 domain-containing protein [Bacteroidaceae bacterium]|nr:DUF4314 domain-containing protein [Bacteroidaceae bacterium]
MFSISKEALQRLREEYTEGSRVELTKMDDPFRTDLVPGTRGTVMFVDDSGAIHVRWDCHSSLAVQYGIDACRKLDAVTITCYGETKVWDDRMEALRFFKQGAQECDGAESRRYANIVFQLMDGLSVCSDKEDDDE